MEYLLYFKSFIISKIINFYKDINELDVKRILVIKLDHIGDVITSLPSVYSIRKKFPNVEITFLAGEWSKDVLKNNPYINNFIIYNSNRFCRNKDKKGLIVRIKYLKNIFKERYDVIAGLRDDWLTVIFSLFYFPKYRIDRGSVRIVLKYKKIIELIFGKKRDNEEIHEIDTNLLIAEKVGCERIFKKPLIFLSKDEKEWAEEFLSGFGINNKKFIIISPGAKWEFRRWDTKKFALLGDKIKKELGLDILIAGSRNEVNTALNVEREMKEETINVAGKTSVRQILSLMEQTVLCIANDGGMVHMASGLNVPVIALFGPQDPKRFGPWSNIRKVYHKKVECFPCKQKKCKRENNPCINLIEVDEVFSGVSEILKNNN